VRDRNAQAGAQTVSYGHAALSQQEKNTRQMSTTTEQLLPAPSAQRRAACGGATLPLQEKNARLNTRSFADPFFRP
jgi:hypothetical protein